MYYNDGKKKALIIAGSMVLVCILACFIYYIIHTHGNIFGGKTHKSVAGIPDPVQKEADGSVEFKLSGYDVTIVYLYSYDIEALVLHTNSFAGYNFGNKLSPVDLALGWGPVAELNGQINFHWDQSNRWYSWKVDSYEEMAKAGGEDVVGNHSANTHIIPADSTVRKQVKKIKAGNHIRLKGYLVSVYAEKGDKTFYWDSSTTREDRGDGACEVMYVTDVEWLD